MIKTPTVLTVLFLLLTFSVGAQETDNIWSLNPAWEVGDTFSFKVTKIKQQWKADLLTKNDSSSYIAQFKVLEVNEYDTKISWTCQTNLYQSFSIPLQFSNELKDFEITEVIYTTDDMGSFTGIENWQEISDKAANIFEKIIEIAKKRGVNTEIEEATGSLRNIYASKEGIEQLIYKELQILHFPYNILLFDDKPFQYEELIPNMMGGKPLRGDGEIRILSADEKANTGVISNTLQLKPEDTKKFLQMFFKKLGVPDKEMKQAMKKAVYNISDNNRFAIDFERGIPIYIQTIRTTVIDIANDKGKRVDTMIIELLN